MPGFLLICPIVRQAHCACSSRCGWGLFDIFSLCLSSNISLFFLHNPGKWLDIDEILSERAIKDKYSLLYRTHPVTQGSRVRYPVWQHTFVSPSAFSRRAVVSNWRKYVHEVLVNRIGGLSLPRKSVVRLTDRPDMTLDVYRGRKTTIQQQQNTPSVIIGFMALLFNYLYEIGYFL